MTQTSERRSFFRINDIIGLSYSVIKAGEPIPSQASTPAAIQNSRMLAEINSEFNQAANTVWRESPAIAKALGLLNRKIAIVAGNCQAEESLPVDLYEEKTANISGCGMAFHCREPLTSGTRLTVTVVLKPANIDLQFTARVVRCEQDENSANETYLMRIEIEPGNDTAQEQLVQHVVQKQFENPGLIRSTSN